MGTIPGSRSRFGCARNGFREFRRVCRLPDVSYWFPPSFKRLGFHRLIPPPPPQVLWLFSAVFPDRSAAKWSEDPSSSVHGIRAQQRRLRLGRNVGPFEHHVTPRTDQSTDILHRCISGIQFPFDVEWNFLLFIFFFFELRQGLRLDWQRGSWIEGSARKQWPFKTRFIDRNRGSIVTLRHTQYSGWL